MKKWNLILIIGLFLLSMTACTSTNTQEEETPQFLDVKLSVTPEQAEINTPVTFEAKVTYGDENVTDADEVSFEIWRANDENHEKIEVKHEKNGIYSLEKAFNTEGTYYIYAHVTARSMHNMPKKEFVIGTPSEQEEESSSTTMDEDSEEHSDH